MSLRFWRAAPAADDLSTPFELPSYLYRRAQLAQEFAGDRRGGIECDPDPADIPAGDEVERIQARWRARVKMLGRDYGRASATIHQLRGEVAELRQRAREGSHAVDDAVEVARRLGEVIVERDEALAALDSTKPVPTARQLGAVLEQQWYRYSDLPGVTTPEAWAIVAEVAIDRIRGTWPLDKVDQAGTPKTSPGAPTEGMSPPPSGAGERVAPGDTHLAARVERHLEDLAEALAAKELALAGGQWALAHDHFRSLYRGFADAVALAGWRPPVEPLARVGTVARVLTDHELLVDGCCRCGWNRHLGVIDVAGEFWHAEHVAQQLISTGALA